MSGNPLEELLSLAAPSEGSGNNADPTQYAQTPQFPTQYTTTTTHTTTQYAPVPHYTTTTQYAPVPQFTTTPQLAPQPATQPGVDPLSNLLALAVSNAPQPQTQPPPRLSTHFHPHPGQHARPQFPHPQYGLSTQSHAHPHHVVTQLPFALPNAQYAHYQKQLVNVSERGSTDSVANILNDIMKPMDEPEPEFETPDGMTVELLLHQRTGLAWLVNRENTPPYAGILADEQGLGKTVQIIALIVTNTKFHPQNQQNSTATPALPQTKKNEDVSDSGSESSFGSSSSGSSPSGSGSSSSGSESDSSKSSSDAGSGVDERDELTQQKHKTGKKRRRKLEKSGGTRSQEDDKRRKLAANARAQNQALLGGTLVVCPLSVVSQWCAELEAKTTRGKLAIHMYHGPPKTRRSARELVEYDVVVTTYSMVSQEHKITTSAVQTTATAGSRAAERSTKGSLFAIKWLRIVLDEGHFIKNANTACARACHALHAERRWILTGTPVQNSVKDLYSLFRFIRFQPYDTLDKFKSLSSQMSKLQEALVQVMKRRTKESKVNGELILKLPERTIKEISCEFSEQEQKIYESISQKAKARLERNEISSGASNKYADVLSNLLKLRLACNHPHLGVRHNASAIPSLTTKYKIPEEVLQNALECDALETDTCQSCTQKTELFLARCGHVYCMECLTSDAGMARCAVCGRVLVDEDKHESNGSPQTMQTYQLAQIKQLFDAVKEKDQEDQLFGPNRASTKIKYLLNTLQKEAESDDPRKIIVFSQWVCTLDIVIPHLRRARFHAFQIDGRMNMPKRTEEIEKFKLHKGFAVLMMSLHTGSLGLNLTFASIVILLDAWWNPAIEAQAIDRVHRIGQTRPVQVLKLMIKGSVEERVLEIQRKKLETIKQAYSAHTKLTLDEMLTLFQ